MQSSRISTIGLLSALAGWLAAARDNGLDSRYFRMDKYVSSMFREALAFLLIVSWVVLSGFDLLEDLNLPKPTNVHALPDASVPNGDGGFNVLNNIVESADHKQPYASFFFNLAGIDFSADGVLLFKKVSQLHKLYRVFLI